MYDESLNPKGQVLSLKSLEMRATQSLAANLKKASKMKKLKFLVNLFRGH